MSSPRNTYVAIVDDDESICRSLGRLLRTADIQSVTYLSAEAFLEDQEQPPFDCLVLDVQLGGMSGIELHRQLVANGLATPVIYITAHDDPAMRTRAQAAGCAGYFRKNDSGRDVVEAIRGVVARRRAAPSKVDGTPSNGEKPGP